MQSYTLESELCVSHVSDFLIVFIICSINLHCTLTNCVYNTKLNCYFCAPKVRKKLPIRAIFKDFLRIEIHNLRTFQGLFPFLQNLSTFQGLKKPFEDFKDFQGLFKDVGTLIIYNNLCAVRAMILEMRI